MLDKSYINQIIFFLLIFHLNVQPLSQPLIKNGRYYYGPTDTHEHINLQKALKFLGRKLASPVELKNKLIAFVNRYFYETKPVTKADTAFSPLMPSPIQTIPHAHEIEPVITWIGHASFLIQINGFNILTDPIFGDIKILNDPIAEVRSSIITLTKRAIKPGITLKNIPHIDAIVISHDHSDHTDTDGLMALQKKCNPAIFIPVGSRSLFRSMGFTRIIECTWWDRYKLTKGDQSISITCVPAYHWSVRFSLQSYRRSLWSGWMISNQNTNIYFAGDTAYGPFFKEIGEQFPSIDVALLPIGPSGPLEEKENKHKYQHIDAREAVDAFIDLNARTFVPMHYGTFGWGPDHLMYPLPMLLATWKDKEALLQGKRLLLARCGESYGIARSTISK